MAELVYPKGTTEFCVASVYTCITLYKSIILTKYPATKASSRREKRLLYKHIIPVYIFTFCYGSIIILYNIRSRQIFLLH